MSVVRYLKELLTHFSSENVTSFHFKKTDIKIWILNQNKVTFFQIIFVPKHRISEMNSARTKNRNNAIEKKLIETMRCDFQPWMNF